MTGYILVLARPAGEEKLEQAAARRTISVGLLAAKESERTYCCEQQLNKRTCAGVGTGMKKRGDRILCMRS
jgi:hypothetical protein